MGYFETFERCPYNSQGIYLYKRHAFPLTEVEISAYVSADESLDNFGTFLEIAYISAKAWRLSK